MFKNASARLLPRRRKASRERARYFAPTLEQLENRVVLSLTIFEAEPNDAPTVESANDLPLGTGADQESSLVVRGVVSDAGDNDWYQVNLQAGDVIGATVVGRDGLDPDVRLLDTDGTLLWFNDQHSQLSSSWFQSQNSPLPRWNANSSDAILRYVIDTPGVYFIGVGAPDNSIGKYRMDLVAARPGLEMEPQSARQLLYLDFDGATVNASVFAYLGGSGTARLSPLRAFLSNWGLSTADERELIDAVVANVRENLSHDVRDSGINGDFARSGVPGEFDIQILNSLDHPEFGDQFGNHPYMSRVVIGGTTQELGIFTVALAQSVDVGNYEFTDDAVVMLDWLSAPQGEHPASLNNYQIHPSQTRLDLVAEAIGTLASHEASHNFGNWHTDLPWFYEPGSTEPNVPNIMDPRPVPVMVGPDRVYGTRDDEDLDFGLDTLAPVQTLDGQVNTLSPIAFGLATGTAQTLHTESLPSVVADQSLTTTMAEPLLSRAISHWERAGAPVRKLDEIRLRVADLPGTQIGRAYASTITIDSNAAGWGWAIDAHGARGRLDLLSALTHEVGHLLDYEHDYGGHDVMAPHLTPGLRLLQISSPEYVQLPWIPQLSGPFVRAASVSEDPFAAGSSLRTASVDADPVMIGGLKQASSVSVPHLMPMGASQDWRIISADLAVAMFCREKQSNNSEGVLRENDLLDLVIADVSNE